MQKIRIACLIEVSGSHIVPNFKKGPAKPISEPALPHVGAFGSAEALVIVVSGAAACADHKIALYDSGLGTILADDACAHGAHYYIAADQAIAVVGNDSPLRRPFHRVALEGERHHHMVRVQSV